MSDTDRLIAVTLIDCINNQGYLDESLEELLDAFDPEQIGRASCRERV